MSLGGYITSLVASVEDGLTCAVLGVPVADLIEVLGGHGGLPTMTRAATPSSWPGRSGG